MENTVQCATPFYFTRSQDVNGDDCNRREDDNNMVQFQHQVQNSPEIMKIMCLMVQEKS